MIDHLNEQRNLNGFGVGHIYFEYQEQKQQTCLAIVASLVKQLLSQIPPTEFPKDIEKKYQEEKTQHASADDLTDMLLSMPKRFARRRVFVVCDALDETDQHEQREELLPLFHCLRASGFALFLTTRPHPADVQESFQNASIIELSPMLHDIRRYVKERLTANPGFQRILRASGSDGLNSRTISKIVDSAAGMCESLPSFYEFFGTNDSYRFLLAKFNVDYIVGLRTVGGVEQALLNLSLPETTGMAIDNSPSERENERRMDDVYNRMIDSIRNLPHSVNRKYAFRALSWIGYATRTLTAQELLVAICVEAEQYQLNDGNMYTLEGLLDICNGLVVADEDGQAVRLVHFSARNYLDRSKAIPKDTRETYRAITCSTYLSFDILREQQHGSSKDLGNLMRNLPFLDYAANNLAFHLSKVEHGHYPETTSSVLKLLEDKGYRRAYCKAKKGIGKQLEIPRLNLACAIGYDDAVRALLDEAEVDANAKDTTYGLTPLMWAARMGNEAVVKRLLENRNVDVNAKDTGDGLTPLSWAVKKRHEAVVKRLLDEGGVDRNCKDSMGRTPLSLVIGDHTGKILTLLLGKGAEVNFTYKEVGQYDFGRILWYGFSQL